MLPSLLSSLWSLPLYDIDNQSTLFQLIKMAVAGARTKLFIDNDAMVMLKLATMILLFSFTFNLFIWTDVAFMLQNCIIKYQCVIELRKSVWLFCFFFFFFPKGKGKCELSFCVCLLLMFLHLLGSFGSFAN